MWMYSKCMVYVAINVNKSESHVYGLFHLMVHYKRSVRSTKHCQQWAMTHTCYFLSNFFWLAKCHLSIIKSDMNLDCHQIKWDTLELHSTKWRESMISHKKFFPFANTDTPFAKHQGFRNDFETAFQSQRKKKNESLKYLLLVSDFSSGIVHSTSRTLV